MVKVELSKVDQELVEEFANCNDVINNMPQFLYARYELGDLKEVTKQLEKDLKHHLSKNRKLEEIDQIISDTVKEIKKRREDFGRYEVVPYFRRKEINFLMKLHKQTLDVAILTVLCREGVINIPKEKEEEIKNRIWLGLELRMYAMLGGIQIPEESTFSDELIEKISKECVEILYSKIKEEREKYLRHILSVLDFKHKVSLYNLDSDLWRFFTVIEAVRLLNVSGEFVHDLIELSELLKKMEEVEREIK
ncbi:MAG: hypothetical protein ACE5K4_05425 [Candidatus Hydrothermarchaeota archaeon]